METLYFILVLLLSNGDAIEIAAYDSFSDCDEIAYHMQAELRESAIAICIESN